jgi:hypothetical protein
MASEMVQRGHWFHPLPILQIGTLRNREGEGLLEVTELGLELSYAAAQVLFSARHWGMGKPEHNDCANVPCGASVVGNKLWRQLTLGQECLTETLWSFLALSSPAWAASLSSAALLPGQALPAVASHAAPDALHLQPILQESGQDSLGEPPGPPGSPPYSQGSQGKSFTPSSALEMKAKGAKHLSALLGIVFLDNSGGRRATVPGRSVV